MDIPKEVKILGADKHVITVEKGGQRYKLFQIIFASDGSLFVDFPYFSNATGIASEVILDPSITYPANNISLSKNGKITSHLVKYSHHPDGRAHFSQTGKIFTKIKKQATPLKNINGHLFTVMLQGMQDFQKAMSQRDQNQINLDRTVVVFHLGDEVPLGLKFVGRWYSWEYVKDKFGTSNSNKTTVGPQIMMELEKDKIIQGFLLSARPGNINENNLLFLSCEIVPLVYKDGPSGITFIGGFDDFQVVNDLSKTTSMLVLSYPITNPDELKKKIGTIDYRPNGS